MRPARVVRSTRAAQLAGCCRFAAAAVLTNVLLCLGVSASDDVPTRLYLRPAKATPTSQPAPAEPAASSSRTTEPEPARSAPSDHATTATNPGIQIRLVDADDPAGNLNWRPPSDAARTIAPTAKLTSAVQQDRQTAEPRSSHIRMAVQLAPLTELQDPFEDGHLQHDESLDDDLPPEPPRSLTNKFSAQAPVDPPPGPRIYNERDCEAEEEHCRTARQRMLFNPISEISPDITPNFRPDVEREEQEREKEMQLAAAAPKPWRNRRGEILATGRFTDFQFGRVVVTRPDGSIVRLPFGQLSEDDLCFVTAWWDLPTECTLDDPQFQGRHWIASTLTWKASALCHKPLYFEEVQLERYGHTAGPLVQPVVSGAHFFLNIATLPYQMGINPPQECRYPLGYYRPGNCAPWLIPPVPLSVRGGLLQAGVITGGAFIFP